MKIMLATFALLPALAGCSSHPEPLDLQETAPHATGDAVRGKLDRAGPSRSPTPTAVVATSTDGALWAFDPDDAAVIDNEPANAVDALGSPLLPGRFLTTSWLEEGGGRLSELTLTPDGISRTSDEPLPTEDTRLLHAVPFLALASGEGTTLLSFGGGRSTFGTSSYVTRTGPAGLDLWLLERSSHAPVLAHLRHEGSLYEVERFTTTTPALSCAPRLVRGAPSPWLAGVHGNSVFVQRPDGTTPIRLERAARVDACVEDALWLEGSRDIVLLTGPDIRVHVLATDGTHDGETLVMPGQLWHDPRPRRRLSYDDVRARLWMALSDRLETRVHTADGRLERDKWIDCDAESVALVW